MIGEELRHVSKYSTRSMKRFEKNKIKIFLTNSSLRGKKNST